MIYPRRIEFRGRGLQVIFAALRTDAELLPHYYRP
jgi:hypothetical protein